MCRLSAIKTCSTHTSWSLKAGPIGYSKTEQNYHFMLPTIPKDRSQNLFNFSVPFHQENAKWWNINVFCHITSENVYWGKITWPPTSSNWSALSNQHLCCRFKSFFISKSHHKWGFQLLIAHKQNPHTHRSTSLL
jgi:hypothetical protein